MIYQMYALTVVTPRIAPNRVICFFHDVTPCVTADIEKLRTRMAELSVFSPECMYSIDPVDLWDTCGTA